MAKKVFTDESLATLVSETKAYTDSAVSGKANSSHNHAASNITSGTLSSDRLPTVPVAKGGTGATTAAGALTNLGITATAAELNYVDGVTSNVQTQLNNIKNNYLPLTGGTVTGTTVFSKVQDAVADSYNSPAVVIGGQPTQAHLELDNNEIQAKSSETKAGNLFLNSNGGTVHVGFDGLKIDSEASIVPEYAISGNVGTAELPFNKMYGRYHYIYGGENAEYGNLRVGTTGTTSTAGVATLQLGNAIATGTAHNASGKITMYGSGTAFTNIMPSDRTSGSNAVKLPSASGTLALAENSTKVATMTTNEYNALTTEQIDANTLYMLTDSEEEVFITVDDIDAICGSSI